MRRLFTAVIAVSFLGTLLAEPAMILAPVAALFGLGVAVALVVSPFRRMLAPVARLTRYARRGRAVWSQART